MNSPISVYVKRGGRWCLLTTTRQFRTLGDAERYYACHGTVHAWHAREKNYKETC